jgi:hypothetical protein
MMSDPEGSLAKPFETVAFCGGDTTEILAATTGESDPAAAFLKGGGSQDSID